MASGNTLCVFTPLNNEPPAAAYATLDLRNYHPVLDFDGAADEEAVFTSILPRNYAGGGLTVYLHVAFTSATSGSAYWQAAIERDDDASLDTDADSFAAFQGTAGIGYSVTCHITTNQGRTDDRTIFIICQER